MTFTNGNKPNCRGLTLEELGRVDFSKMDFSEVAADIFKKMALPDIGDIENRVKDSFKSITKFDDETPAHPKNKAAGVNQNLMGPTLAEEKAENERLAKLEQERLAQLERERLEQERLAKIEAERKLARKQEISIELVPLKKKEQELILIIQRCSSVQMNNRLWPVPPEYVEAVKESQETSPKLSSIRQQIQVLEQELRPL